MADDWRERIREPAGRHAAAAWNGTLARARPQCRAEPGVPEALHHYAGAGGGARPAHRAGRRAHRTADATRHAAQESRRADQLSRRARRARRRRPALQRRCAKRRKRSVSTRTSSSVIGYLPDHVIVSGFLVTPVVAFVRPGFELLLDPREVESTFEVPLQLSVLARESSRAQTAHRHERVRDRPASTFPTASTTSGEPRPA